MYYCSYFLDGKNYYSEVLAKEEKEAVANSYAMFGDTLNTVFESDKPVEESDVREVKTFWIKGMSPDTVTDALRFDMELFQNYLEQSLESVKRSMRNRKDEDMVMAIKSILNTTETGRDRNLWNMLQDSRQKDVVINVFCAGMIDNHMMEMDFHDALNIAVNCPEMLKEKFESDISYCYIGKSFKGLQKVYKKHEHEILTFFGFGLFGAIMFSGGGLSDEARVEWDKRQKDMVDEINRSFVK